MKINIILIYIIIVIYLFYKNMTNKIPILLISVIACNRYVYLNKTLLSLSKHLLMYEKKLTYNFLYIDQGTKQRKQIIKQFNFHNVVLMNPIGYSLSFNIIFSYLYTKYVLFLEEDWETVYNIEKYILHPSFIMESIELLDKVKVIYGIILRELRDIEVSYSLSINTIMGRHTLYVLRIPKNRNTFTNGPCIYRTKELKRLKYYVNEYLTSQYFKGINYILGFTYKGLYGGENSTNIQYVMKHIGKNSTKHGLCNIWLY